MAVDTKQKLVSWIKRQMGWPTIQLEFDEHVINDNIDKAIKRFSKHSGDVTYRSAIVLTISADEADYTLPDDTFSVMGLDTSSSRNGIMVPFTPINTLYAAGMLDGLIWGRGGGYSIVNYYLGMMHLKEIEQLTTTSFFTRFNTYTKVLTLSPIPNEDNIGVLEIYTTYDPGEGESLIYDELWVQEYALALCMMVIGKIWGKYDGSPLPDGATLNSGMMIDEGKEEKIRLEESLLLEEGEPLGFMMG